MSTTSECPGCIALDETILAIKEMIEEKDDHIHSLEDELAGLTNELEKVEGATDDD